VRRFRSGHSGSSTALLLLAALLLACCACCWVNCLVGFLLTLGILLAATGLTVGLCRRGCCRRHFKVGKQLQQSGDR
jgi:UPF0716 family protein affecting phage T7 exclusion